jgi:hypothetical protein
MRLLLFLTLATLSVACSRAADIAPAPSQAGSAAPAATQPTNAAHPKGTLAIGEPITQPLLPLSEIADHPSRYAARTIATSGKVTAVCQEMGCWMEVEDQAGRAHVRMHGHAFYVPRSASGHVARVQATVVTRAGDGDCEEGRSASAAAKVELDATGVELD